MVTLDYRDARPIYTQICDGIRDQILSGILQPGDKLPSVRELAGMLTINPNTIQRSYHQLEAQGWIVTVPGKGCFACEVPQAVQDSANLLWGELDRVLSQLEQAGIPRTQIIRHIEEGGK